MFVNFHHSSNHPGHQTASKCQPPGNPCLNQTENTINVTGGNSTSKPHECWVESFHPCPLPIASFSQDSRRPEEPKACWYDLVVAAKDLGVASNDSACCDLFLHQEQPMTKKTTPEIQEGCQSGTNGVTYTPHVKKGVVVFGTYLETAPEC